MNPGDIEAIEISLLLEAIYRRYGYDFRSYSRASITRRVKNFLAESDCRTAGELIPRVLHDEAFFAGLLTKFSITVTEMFRDPLFYRTLKAKVFPLLATHPFIRVWHAGCATGEEVYSLAILLVEAGLYDRATIFATDFNDEALAQAREGIYPMDMGQQYAANYLEAGGTDSFSHYCHARYGAITVNADLKRNITFANHNLVTDGVFGEMHLVLCRNVLIYFEKELQNRVLELFTASLVYGGYLCLGSRESLRFSAVKDDFAQIDATWRIFQKTTWELEAEPGQTPRKK